MYLTDSKKLLLQACVILLALASAEAMQASKEVPVRVTALATIAAIVSATAASSALVAATGQLCMHIKVFLRMYMGAHVLLHACVFVSVCGCSCMR